MSFSYKLPAQDDGVDYGDADEVSKFTFARNKSAKLIKLYFDIKCTPLINL